MCGVMIIMGAEYNLPRVQSLSPKIVCKNSVAGAQFFHFMVETFITDVLGVGSNHRGLYGNTKAFYGTVEQQGRLTLHLHMLLLIKGCLNP